MEGRIEVEMEFDRETKNTYRFSEIVKGKPPMIGNLYIQKWALPDRAGKIKVSIEVIE